LGLFEVVGFGPVDLGLWVLIGVSGLGKTTLSCFVAWMNGLTVFQIAHSRYSGADSGADFDDDLRTVLWRSGCKAKKIYFIMDESNVFWLSLITCSGNYLIAYCELAMPSEESCYQKKRTRAQEQAGKQKTQKDGGWPTRSWAEKSHVDHHLHPTSLMAGNPCKAFSSIIDFNKQFVQISLW
jgi:dynein heavy chain 1, cytosolic